MVVEKRSSSSLVLEDVMGSGGAAVKYGGFVSRGVAAGRVRWWGDKASIET
jgi:hypothetical protein